VWLSAVILAVRQSRVWLSATATHFAGETFAGMSLHENATGVASIYPQGIDPMHK
jgi:hypothetical protein